jgi:hypothetical protein
VSKPYHLYLEDKMSSMADEFKELFKDYPLYSQYREGIDPYVIVKLSKNEESFFLVEYDPEEENAFGFATGSNNWVFVTLTDLKGAVRDLEFQKKRLSECLS